MFLTRVIDLDKRKPVIIAGDMNVAHQEIGNFNLLFKIIFFLKIYVILTQTEIKQLDLLIKKEKLLLDYWMLDLWMFGVLVILAWLRLILIGIFKLNRTHYKIIYCVLKCIV